MPEITSRLSTALADRYRIERHLGEGGMATVYLAEDLKHDRKVALKVLSSGLGMTTKAVIRFRREAETAAKLHHTNIVPVHATGEEDGTHYYAMCEGSSLEQEQSSATRSTR